MMESIQCVSYKSAVGELIIATHGGEVCMIDWKYRKMRKAIDQRISTALGAPLLESAPNQLQQQTIAWLHNYFVGDQSRFEIPFKMVGSAFQKEVWNALLEIERGCTISYIELARKLGKPDAVRAVAAANGANALSVVVPCHRVIGSDGQLVGYAGGLTAKTTLLELEGARKPSLQISLF